MSTGSMIAGRYRIEGRVGVGGMSTVLLALDERLERKVAVKLLAEHLADDPTFVSRFRREALAAARLVHPNIVQVFDSGFDEAASQHFIVMEYVPGQSCAEILRERGHLDVGEVVDIVEQCCRGLDYAHRHGVVHRDVKPGNLLVSDSGVVKLADFGIARATGQASITQVGSVLGTAAYLAPEQARGEEAGPTADLYSLGVVTYQLLSGRLPYEANSLSELALKQQREAPIPLQRLNADVPEALSEAVALGISVVAEERPRSATRLAEMIADGARGIGPFHRGRDTRRADPSEAATRMLRSRQREAEAETTVMERGRPARGAGARTPRTVPARRPQPPPAQPPRPAGDRNHAPMGGRDHPGSAPRRGHRRRTARRVFWLCALLLVIAIVVAVVAALLNQANQTLVHYHQVVANDAQNAINQVQHLIGQYRQK